MSTLYHNLADVYSFNSLYDCRMIMKNWHPTPPKHIYPRKARLARGRMGFSLNSYISLIVCDTRWALLSCDSHAYTCPITTGMKINLPSQEIHLPLENMVSKLFFCGWFLGRKKKKVNFPYFKNKDFFFLFLKCLTQKNLWKHAFL